MFTRNAIFESFESGCFHGHIFHYCHCIVHVVMQSEDNYDVWDALIGEELSCQR